jgi:hypothetical protein
MRALNIEAMGQRAVKDKKRSVVQAVRGREEKSQRKQ